MAKARRLGERRAFCSDDIRRWFCHQMENSILGDLEAVRSHIGKRAQTQVAFLDLIKRHQNIRHRLRKWPISKR